MKRTRCLLAVASLFLFFSGCATIYNPATGRQETVIDSSVEIALGNLARAQMGLVSLKMGKVSPEDWTRVQAIGKRIAAMSDRKDVPYQFGIIQEKSINAFTLPGGTIYIHTGTLAMATDDELAAVIAHEVGHVAARHVAKHLRADLGFTALLSIAQAAGVSAEAARLSDSLYGLFSRGFSRQDELEADRLGIRYTDRAGFDPQAMVTFFDKLLTKHPEGPMEHASVWQSTHPLTADRIAKAKEEIVKLEGEKFCPECGRTYYGTKAKFCERDGAILKEKKR